MNSKLNYSLNTGEPKTTPAKSENIANINTQTKVSIQSTVTNALVGKMPTRSGQVMPMSQEAGWGKTV